MLQNAFTKIQSFWAKTANIGVTNDLSFHEKKKTQILNIVIATGTPINLFWSIYNFSVGRTLSCITSLLLMTGGILILIINSYRKLLLSRLILTFLGSLVFILQAVLFRNGGEYYLLTNLIVIFIYFNERIYILLISIFNYLLFIGIKIFLATSTYTYQPVSVGRIIFNTSWALLVMVIALLFFKNEQKDYQEEVEEKNKELEKMNDAKQKLFSIIAHDLRSPIGQLKSSLDLVNREYLSPEAFKQISSKLSSEVDELHSTLDNLLKWSISQLQGIKASPEKVLLSNVFEKMYILFKQSLERKNITCKIEGGYLSVWADPDHLMLVFRNLVSNAVKYSYQDGTIHLRAYTQEGRIVIEVADTGMGMNDEIKAAAFKSGNMISNAGTSNEKGTGLGLKLCKEFIEKNNGKIWVESTEQKGSCFYVSLPEAN